MFWSKKKPIVDTNLVSLANFEDLDYGHDASINKYTIHSNGKLYIEFKYKGVFVNLIFGYYTGHGYDDTSLNYLLYSSGNNLYKRNAVDNVLQKLEREYEEHMIRLEEERIIEGVYNMKNKQLREVLLYLLKDKIVEIK